MTGMICAALEIKMWITKPGNPGWQAKILSIITTGFGNMDHFNHAVRRVMKRIDGLSTRTLLGAAGEGEERIYNQNQFKICQTNIKSFNGKNNGFP